MTTLCERRAPHAHVVVMTVAEFYDVSVTEVVSHRRYQRIAYARQVCMYLIRKLCGYNLNDIGRALGNRDHATIIYGIRKIEADLLRDETLASQLRAIERSVPVVSEPVPQDFTAIPPEV